MRKGDQAGCLWVVGSFFFLFASSGWANGPGHCADNLEGYTWTERIARQTVRDQRGRAISRVMEEVAGGRQSCRPGGHLKDGTPLYCIDGRIYVTRSGLYSYRDAMRRPPTPRETEPPPERYFILPKGQQWWEANPSVVLWVDPARPRTALTPYDNHPIVVRVFPNGQHHQFFRYPDASAYTALPRLHEDASSYNARIVIPGERNGKFVSTQDLGELRSVDEIQKHIAKHMGGTEYEPPPGTADEILDQALNPSKPSLKSLIRDQRGRIRVKNDYGE